MSSHLRIRHLPNIRVVRETPRYCELPSFTSILGDTRPLSIFCYCGTPPGAWVYYDHYMAYVIGYAAFKSLQDAALQCSCPRLEPVELLYYNGCKTNVEDVMLKGVR